MNIVNCWISEQILTSPTVIASPISSARIIKHIWYCAQHKSQVWGAHRWLAGSYTAWSWKTWTSIGEQTCKRRINVQRSSWPKISANREDGIKYFKNTLRPHFIKRALSALLWKFFHFIRAKRENMEMLKWIGKCSLLFKRLKDSWMDMLPTNSMSETQRQNQYHADGARENEERRSRSQELLNPVEPETREECNATQVAAHESLFPFGDNLTTMFLVASDLGETQRERLTNSPSL